MPVRRRTETDGVTAITHTTIDLTGTVGPVERAAVHAVLQNSLRLSNFNGRIGDLEANCQRMLSRVKARPVRYGSRGWYAEQILQAIKAVRWAIKREKADYAAACAVRVGALGAEAIARHDWPSTRIGLNVPKQRQKASAAGVRTRRNTNADGRQKFRAALDAYFHHHPQHSYQTAAQNLASFRGSGPNATKNLAKRIAREMK
jgi:hypothetical protein